MSTGNYIKALLKYSYTANLNKLLGEIAVIDYHRFEFWHIPDVCLTWYQTKLHVRDTHRMAFKSRLRYSRRRDVMTPWERRRQPLLGGTNLLVASCHVRRTCSGCCKPYRWMSLYCRLAWMLMLFPCLPAYAISLLHALCFPRYLCHGFPVDLHAMYAAEVNTCNLKHYEIFSVTIFILTEIQSKIRRGRYILNDMQSKNVFSWPSENCLLSIFGGKI